MTLEKVENCRTFDRNDHICILPDQQKSKQLNAAEPQNNTQAQHVSQRQTQ